MFEEQGELERLIHTFHRMHHACMRGEFEKRDIATANPAILFILLHTSKHGPVTQKEVADLLGFAPPTVAVAVKRMEKAGLIRREPDRTDLRKNHISLTEKGKALTDESLQAERDIFHQIIAGMSPGEIEALKGLYLRMIRNMQELGVRPPHYFHLEKEETN